MLQNLNKMATTFHSTNKAETTTRPDLAKILLITSSFIVIDVLMACHFGNCFDFAAWDLFCVTSSAIYWSDPRYGWKRCFDMSVSIPLFYYHVSCAYHELLNYSQQRLLYLSIALICTGLYSVGVTTCNPKWGQQCTSTMHITGVAANIFMHYYLSQSRQKLYI